MTLTARSPLTVHVPLRVDPEQEIVARLIEATGEAGLAVDPASIINFYVALKSKPLAILAGRRRAARSRSSRVGHTSYSEATVSGAR